MPEPVPGSLAEALEDRELPEDKPGTSSLAQRSVRDREKRLETHRRYNLSAKGQARNRRYEAKRPERRLRWEPARNAGHARRGDA